MNQPVPGFTFAATMRSFMIVRVNAPTGTFINTNVRLLGSNQIADTAVVSMISGVLDIDGNSDTISRLNLTGGTITGTTGKLTVSDLNGSTFNSGSVLANMGGTGQVNITAGGVDFVAEWE